VVSDDRPWLGLSSESKEHRLDSALGESKQDGASQPRSRRENWRSTYLPSLKLYSNVVLWHDARRSNWNP
jgi:hypothetical protein